MLLGKDLLLGLILLGSIARLSLILLAGLGIGESGALVLYLALFDLEGGAGVSLDWALGVVGSLVSVQTIASIELVGGVILGLGVSVLGRGVLELLDEVVDLGDVDLPRVVFIEDFEHGEVLLLV